MMLVSLIVLYWLTLSVTALLLVYPNHQNAKLLVAVSAKGLKYRRRTLPPPPLFLSTPTDSDSGTAEQQQVQLPFISQEEDEELLEKGEWERELMSRNQSVLKPTKLKGIGGSGGFGSSPTTKKKTLLIKQQAEAYATVLKEDGIVRIDKVLSNKLADALQKYVVDLRARATADVLSNKLELKERFADVLHNQNRCDLKVPLGPPEVMDALKYILQKSILPELISQVFTRDGYEGDEATLWELNCFMSNTGSRRQLVHPDQSCETSVLAEDEPVMLTCFVALQDVDVSMGPTNFIPGTHTTESHVQFFRDKASVLGTRHNVLGALPKGACAIFDPRVLHCATANECEDPNKTRALFYFSFKNPKIEHPGSPSCAGYGINNAELTLAELKEALLTNKKKKSSPAIERLKQLECFP